MTKLSLFLATTLATATFGSQTHAATTVEVTRQQGSNASTSFSSTTPITCPDGSAGEVDAFGFISGSELASKQTGTPRTFNDGVTVEIFEYVNSCTGAFTSGSGTIPNGYIPPDKKLRVARMVGSTTFQDFSTGQTVPISVNLKIEGTGPIAATKDNTVSHGSGAYTVTVTHTAGGTREGIVTGTITIDGVELDATFTPTTMSTGTTSTITVTKN
jgi:hypothetical protein